MVKLHTKLAIITDILTDYCYFCIYFRDMKSKTRNPWIWVPSLYFAEGLPYVIVITLSVVMYKQLGLGNAEVAYYTGSC